MGRQWIHIKGRKLLCKEFIYSLDGYRAVAVLRKRGDEICKTCNHMLYVLQVLTDEYLHNENYIEDHWSDFLKKHYTEMSVERKLLLLQKSKAASNLYELDEKEISIARTWCEILVSSVFSEAISYGLMLRLVENAIATESEISDLLKDRYHIEKDYEWYSEDFLGCKLDTPTEIRTEDVLSLYAERVEKIIGTKI